MKNVFKSNSLASCLLGIIIGAAGHAGFEAIVDNNGSLQQSQISAFGSFGGNGNNAVPLYQDNFDRIPEDPDGDCVITPNGKKYHNPDGCISLRKSKRLRIVSSEKAREQGLGPCSKCMN